MQSVITIKDLKKKFPVKGGFYEAVRGVNLEVFEKEIFGFLGPNGAGKTTTLRMLTTLLPIDSGDAFVAGYNVKTQPQEVRRRIGFVSQEGGADRNATGRENLMLQGRLYGMSQAEVKQAANHLIEILSLGECIDRFVTTYSGGQRRRLDVALGMMHKPKILFLDEPTTGLDPQNRANLWNQIKALKKEGITIFITSHYLDEIDFLADRLAIMDQGKIVEVGTPKDLKRQISGDIIHIGVNKSEEERTIQILKGQSFIKEIAPDTQPIRLYVEQGDVALTQILRLLDAEKIVLESISLSVPTLDDVFLKKTGHALREEGGL
ncbi:MAG: ABC transporter [Candidatus Amoebophilus sp. 36-38]|nr:MAG: ABC transporter [Candidatus Amoebophilus sp. 36-38]